MRTAIPGRLLFLAVVLFFLAAALPAAAVPLTGSGSNLPVPSPNVEPAYQVRTITGGPIDFTGSWTSPAQAAWVGSFTATGPIPASTSNPTGTTNYDFTSLPLGYLPAGSYFRLGDLDQGSGGEYESITLRAYDASNAIITAPWLELPVYSSLPGTPSYEFDDSAGSDAFYFFEEATFESGIVAMPSNHDIAFLEVIRTSSFASFSVAAPIPEPGTLPLIGLGLVALTRARKPMPVK